MLKIGAAKGCKGCENDTSSQIKNALHVLKKPLVAKMQMDHLLNPMFQRLLKFLPLSQCSSAMRVPVVVLHKTLSLRQIMMNLMKPNLQSKILLMFRFMIQTLVMNLINLLPLV